MSDDKEKPDIPAESGESPESPQSAGPTEPDVPPDRLSLDPTSRFFDKDKLDRGVGIRFKGKVRTNVQEYSISEGWVKMTVGKSVDRTGRPLTVKSSGPVEAWYEDLGDDAPVASGS